MGVELAVDANFVQFREDGEAVVVRDFGFTLDERRGVAHELEVHGDAVFVDPLAGELLHAVGDFVERSQAGFAGVGVAVTAEERDHFVGLAVDRGFHGGLAGEEGFIGVGFGAVGHRRALGDTELGGAGFDAGEVGFDEALQEIGGTAELSVAEGIGGFRGGDIVAIRIDEAFADDDQTVFLALEGALHVGNELLMGEGNLGEEDDVGRIVRMVPAFGEGGARGDPTRVAAHDFENGDEIALAHGLVVAAHLTDRGGDVFDHGTVTRAVVGDGQVVIDGLGDTDDAELVALFLREFGDLVGGVLGVVATGVEEVANVLRFEDFEHALEIRLVLQLVAAGAEGGAGRVAETANGLLGLRSEIDEILVEDPENAVERAVDFLDAVVIQCFRDHAFDAGVNDGGRAS